MLFNSIEFAFFLPIVFLFYWFVVNKSLSKQNLFLVIISYIFYGWWDWRFLSLLFFSSFVDFSIGRLLASHRRIKTRKLLLIISVVVNLGILGFFKYYNFFIESFSDAFTLLGRQPSLETLNIILPLGISFYTFQTLSYSIDVYNRKLEPSRDIVSFLAFVSFFPQLVAGPIERATNLLPQFLSKRRFDLKLASDGMRQILWGLFKKVVIADNCAEHVTDIFNNYPDYNGSTLLIGSILFSFQIYCDFSGYSDMAIGTARLFGFSLMRNFAFPYFSRDIAEFWRRWHISLSTWFRDYVYIPLGGSKGGTMRKVRNTFVVFTLSGFWHGANWTFIVWGVLNALYFLPLLISNKNRIHTDTVANNTFLPSIKELFQIATTFLFTNFAWIFFRSESVGHAIDYLKGIFSISFFKVPEVVPIHLLLLLTAFVFIEWLGRKKLHAVEFDNFKIPVFFRWATYSSIIIVIMLFAGKQAEFIYFQF